MATKNCSLGNKQKINKFLFDFDSKDDYNTLNLNQNHKFATNDILSSCKNDLGKYQPRDSVDYLLQKDVNLKNQWKKSESFGRKKCPILSDYCGSRDDSLKLYGNSSNSSTLSLHIAAYENENEDKNNSKKNTKALDKAWKNSTNFFNNSITSSLTLFEFPRQQDNNIREPEIAQFKASQKLFNPHRNIVKELCDYAGYINSNGRTSSFSIPIITPSPFPTRIKTEFNGSIVIIDKDLFTAAIDVLQEEHIQVFNNLSISLNEKKECLNIVGLSDLIELKFSSLYCLQHHWMHFQQQQKSYILRFENDAMVQEILGSCFKCFGKNSNIKVAALKYFVLLKAEDAREEQKELLRKLLLQFGTLPLHQKAELLKLFKEYMISLNELYISSYNKSFPLVPDESSKIVAHHLPLQADSTEFNKDTEDSNNLVDGMDDFVSNLLHVMTDSFNATV